MTTGAPPRDLSRLSSISFVVFMLGLMGLFIMLGLWQVERLAEKEALVATVEARIDDAPIAFPPVAQWSPIDPDDIDYRPYALTGSYDHGASVLVFTNLTNRIGQYGGVGYWVMAPFVLEGGGVVWVNRGFVPEGVADDYANGGLGPQGVITIEAIARRPEQANSFTPAPDLADRREWIRNPERLAGFLDQADAQVAPVTFDLPAGDRGALPQGGETQITFPNRHLEYAGTWFLFAAITPIMLGFWLWRQRKPANLAHRGKGH